MFKIKGSHRYYDIVNGVLRVYDCDPRETAPSSYIFNITPIFVKRKFVHPSISRSITEIPYPRYLNYYIDSRGNLLDQEHPLVKTELFKEFLMEE